MVAQLPWPVPSGPMVAVATLLAFEMLPDYFPFSLKENAHLQLDTLAYFLPVEYQKSDSLPSG